MRIKFSRFMNFSIIARLILSYPLLKLGILNRRLSRHSSSGFLILMYHRILSAGSWDWKIQPGMYVSDSSFEMHLRFLTRHFCIVHLKDAVSENGVVYQTDKPLCALTFDDGWIDFYESAFPLLKKYNTPATVFLPSDFTGTGRMFWTDRVPFLLEQGLSWRGRDLAEDPQVSEMAGRIDKLNGSMGSRLEECLEMLKQYPQDRIDCMLDKLAPENDEAGRSFFSWDEARQMRKSGLVSFGSHTCSHSILTTLQRQEVVKELSFSRKKLLKESVCEEGFVPFCYPNGNHNREIVEMVRQAGYSLAVTTMNGWNSSDTDPFVLKRIGIHDDMTCTESMFAWKISNLP